MHNVACCITSQRATTSRLAAPSSWTCGLDDICNPRGTLEDTHSRTEKFEPTLKMSRRGVTTIMSNAGLQLLAEQHCHNKQQPPRASRGPPRTHRREPQLQPNNPLARLNRALQRHRQRIVNCQAALPLQSTAALLAGRNVSATAPLASSSCDSTCEWPGACGAPQPTRRGKNARHSSRQ